MALPELTKSQIREHTADGSFERGEQYLADGAVHSLTQFDDCTLKAQVRGHDVHPYLVTIEFADDTITAVECSCPYYEGSWCKHIVAVLLKTLEDDEIAQSEAAAVRDLVEGSSRDVLVTLLERLAEHNPQLIDQLEREYARLAEDRYTGDPSDDSST